MDVSLNKGLATVKLKPGNSVAPEQFWEVVKKNGFTPKDTHVIVRGDISSTSGKTQLKVSPVNRAYGLVDSANPPEGKPVTVEGTITPGNDSAAVCDHSGPTPSAVREKAMEIAGNKTKERSPELSFVVHIVRNAAVLRVAIAPCPLGARGDNGELCLCHALARDPVPS